MHGGDVLFHSYSFSNYSDLQKATLSHQKQEQKWLVTCVIQLLLQPSIQINNIKKRKPV